MFYNGSNKKRNDMKKMILQISDKLRNGEIDDKQSQSELCFLFNVSDSYSDSDVRNIVLEMNNAAMCGRYGEDRFKLQDKFSAIKKRWKLYLNYR